MPKFSGIPRSITEKVSKTGVTFWAVEFENTGVRFSTWKKNIAEEIHDNCANKTPIGFEYTVKGNFNNIVATGTDESSEQTEPIVFNKPKDNGIHLTSESIKIGALQNAIEFAKLTEDQKVVAMEVRDGFLKFITGDEPVNSLELALLNGVVKEVA